MATQTATTKWQTIKLGDCLSVIRNGLQDKQKKEVGKYKITRIETIGQEFLDLNRVQFADDISAEKVEQFRLRKGDILFSHINSDIHLGKSVLVDNDYSDVLHGMNLLLLRTKNDIILPAFLNFLFKYLRNNRLFIEIASRSVNQSSINQAKLKNLNLTFPQLPEQEAIARVLATIQEAIAGQEALIAKLK